MQLIKAAKLSILLMNELIIIILDWTFFFSFEKATNNRNMFNFIKSYNNV